MEYKTADSLKKLVVIGIISPGDYWMSNYDNGQCYRSKMKQFESGLAKNVTKCSGDEEIIVGMVVAVKDEMGYHRGLVTDIFKRGSRSTYWIRLIDYGNVIETSRKKIYLICNEELKETKFSSLEVTVHGIQPATFDIDNNTLVGEIFHKRKCGNWSLGTYKYVEELFKKNPYVYVKPIKSSERSITGDVYFIENEKMVSLAQRLCDEGLAVLSGLTNKDISIEEKIPEVAFFSEKQNSEVLSVYRRSIELRNSNNKSQSKDISSDLLYKRKPISDSLSSSSSGSVLSEKMSGLHLVTSPNVLSSCSSCDSFTKKNICEAEEESTEEPKLMGSNIFRMVQRNLQLFNEQKKKNNKILP